MLLLFRDAKKNMAIVSGIWHVYISCYKYAPVIDEYQD